VSNDNSGQLAREDFYHNSVVKAHLKGIGIPRTIGSFRDMVASGSSLNLDSVAGLSLMRTLGGVTFSKHPQQINIMDKLSGKLIVSIPI
jgi:hypothetical protein